METQTSNQQAKIGSGWSCLHPLRIVLRLPLLIVHVFLGLPLIYLSFNRFGRAIEFRGQALNEYMQSWWASTLCQIFGIRLQIYGKVGPGPLFVVANHISFLDILLMGSVAKLSFVSKAEIANWPIVGLVAKMGDTVFHQRGSGHSLNGVVDAISEKLGKGGRVAVFPEGRIYCGDRVHRFHARIFRAAIETEVDVLPVCIRYLKNGVLNPRICLCDREERFFWNMLRLLGEPGSMAELRVQKRLSPLGRSRKELAAAAEAAIVADYLKPGNLDAS